MNNFDYLIIGGGIAGLYTAYKLHQHQPHVTIGLLEATSRLGGRIHTIHKSNTQFESGGARFNSDQHRVQNLIKELSLTQQIVPITSDSKYIPVNPKYDTKLETLFPTIDDFIHHMQNYIKEKRITNQELLETSILKFADKHFGPTYPTIKNYLESRYPYFSELGVLNAVEGINLFTNEFASKTQYFVLASGLETIIDKLATKLKNSSKVMIYKETPLDTISYNKDTNQYTITTTTNSLTQHNTHRKPKEYFARNIILALPKKNLQKIHYLTKHDNISQLLKSVQSQPLYRIYACYPLDKKTGKPWFSGLDKVVTNLEIKYIIPYDVKKGLIMISYTDGKYADYWFKHLINGTFTKTLSKQLQMLFPLLDIPKPKWIQHCHWDMGAAYWLPGYNRKEIMPQLVKPFSDESLYICGENYSSHQAWMEGSLETSDMVLERLSSSSTPNNKSRKITLKKTKKKVFSEIEYVSNGGGSSSKNREYTMTEVAKHNKKTDAWIVIGNIVADITEWIPKHPGGDVIMKGVGKDATQLFNSIGHDAVARKMLKKYQIGIVKK